ncbi:uncharacterized protein [Polyergus mexicanus]|uniref:uncharacterized protein isoform X2 n=1 Tax=Polyergus mexicanus TaxID=615972 RepID=UPI0038B58BE9
MRDHMEYHIPPSFCAVRAKGNSPVAEDRFEAARHSNLARERGPIARTAMLLGGILTIFVRAWYDCCPTLPLSRSPSPSSRERVPRTPPCDCVRDTPSSVPSDISRDMSSQICLKWNSFLSNIATSFESLWEEEGLVDVTLASDGQCLTAHKVILSASSPFFKKVFQTNPCQHPVIILQDVHFSELEALLIFIYKGEVNIEQKNLPALLKAAETLQIRGLSGGDIFAKESYKRLAELEQAVAEDVPLTKEETSKKKQKVSKQQNNSILEKALTPRIPQSENTNESATSDQSGKDGEYMLPETLPNPVYHRLEMKIEPLEMAVDDIQKRSPLDKDPAERLDTGQADGNQGSGNSPAEDISGLSGLSGLSGFSDVKPLLYSYQHLPYADLLPSPDIISTWASSRPMDHLACDLMKILFTPEERILCNVNGKMGKQQFDSNKIHLIREVLLHFSGIAPNSIEWEEAWKNCVTKIDTSNRGLKRYLFQRRSVYTQ